MATPRSTIGERPAGGRRPGAGPGGPARVPRRRRGSLARRIALLAAALWSLGGCASRDAAPPGSAAAGPVVRPATVEEILGVVREPGSEAVLVNVWATWCAPCRAEFPDLVRIHRTYAARGLKLVLVSADFDDRIAAVRRFLGRHGVDFASYLKVGDDMHFINTLDPRWTGALPATFIYDGAGRLRHFHEGMATFATFEKHVLEVLGSGTPGPSTGEES